MNLHMEPFLVQFHRRLIQCLFHGQKQGILLVWHFKTLSFTFGYLASIIFIPQLLILTVYDPALMEYPSNLLQSIFPLFHKPQIPSIQHLLLLFHLPCHLHHFKHFIKWRTMYLFRILSFRNISDHPMHWIPKLKIRTTQQLIHIFIQGIIYFHSLPTS